MKEIRIHGRGGQGVVTAAELLAVAAFYDGKFSQSFPFFGVERQGAPVTSFAKIDSKFIRSREQIYEPDFIIIQDVSLLKTADVLNGVKKNTIVLINSKGDVKKLGLKIEQKVYTIPATEIALSEIGKPFFNTALLGAFIALTKLASLKSLQKAIRENLAHKGTGIINGNLASMQRAYKEAEKCI